ncbi:MAG: thioredoxin family protein [Bacilli bacterium]|nr:thioredoxin family protein [Bacilli bacterium]
MKIIKIGAIWCPGCLVMRKTWKNIMKDYPDLNILELDYDMDSSEVNKYYQDKILPVIIFISDNGKELSRLIGEVSEDTIRSEIDKYD